MDVTANSGCKGCGATVRVPLREIERLLAEYFKNHPDGMADENVWRRRLKICAACPDLLYGCTCRHCGCLVDIRARIADKGCPALPDRWQT